MHMADALISPAVGGAFWAVSGGLLGYCARRVRKACRDDLVPMMGVLGAFVFTAQMINFTIPGTGSSGHLGGGLLLAALLGPHAAFLVIASVLAVQALFFADGGLLALGCNIFNLGFIPAFMAYPLVYQPLAGPGAPAWRRHAGAMTGAVAGLLAGASAVVGQTILSGITSLPAGAFASLMLPIHLAIGLVEGLVTAAVVAFIHRARPETMAIPEASAAGQSALVGLTVSALVLGGTLSWFASTHPDGLEWSIERAATTNPEATSPVHMAAGNLQARTSILPDYSFPTGEDDGAREGTEASWPAASLGTSVSGLAGGLVTLLIVAGAGALIRTRGTRAAPAMR